MHLSLFYCLCTLHAVTFVISHSCRILQHGLVSRGKQLEHSPAQSYQSNSARKAQKYQKWGQGNHWTCSVASAEVIWVFYTNTLSGSSGLLFFYWESSINSNSRNKEALMPKWQCQLSNDCTGGTGRINSALPRPPPNHMLSCSERKAV